MCEKEMQYCSFTQDYVATVVFFVKINTMLTINNKP